MATFNSAIPYSDTSESIPLDEAASISRIVEIVKTMLAEDLAENDKLRADVHVKTHGYVEGHLTVLPDLPTELAQGLFATPSQYAVVVRFSNSANRPMPDLVPDGRGMAIKVKNVVGEMVSVDPQGSPAQDFVLINHPVFFAANAQDFLRLEQVLEDSSHNPLHAAKALTGGVWNPIHWHWNEMLKAAGIVAKIPTHPAAANYFSMSPFRFGNYVAKFRVQPTTNIDKSWLEMLARLATKSDAMRLALEETLQHQSLELIFRSSYEHQRLRCRLKMRR
ncbi:MAG: hypothetical protein R3C03_09945 [Pirellulaceae bacterium]